MSQPMGEMDPETVSVLLQRLEDRAREGLVLRLLAYDVALFEVLSLDEYSHVIARADELLCKYMGLGCDA